MVKVLTSLELSVVVREIQQLIGSKVSKIHQPSSRVLSMHLFKTGGQNFLLKIDSGVGMYLTSYLAKNPLTPLSFCLFLRKHLNNSTLIAVKQNNLERIIEFHFDARDGLRILVCELFSKGNFLICDSAYKILNCASIQRWKDREVKTGEIYKYPPPSFNLLSLNKQVFQQYLAKYPQHELVKLIATLGLGGTYAEEVCILAKIQKNTVVQMLNAKEFDTVFITLSKVIDNFKSKAQPQVLYEDSKPVDATPFKLNFYASKDSRGADSFNQALDLLYTSELASKDRSESTAKYEQERQRLENIYNAQKQSAEEYEQECRKNQKLAEMIYANYPVISTIFSKIKQAVDSGHDWYEVYQVLQREKEQGIHEASLVREIRPETRQIIIALEQDITLDLTKSLEQNAGDFYDKAKKAHSKIESAQQVVNRTQQELDKLDRSREDSQQTLEAATPKPAKTRRQEWFEKFRWFKTSSGLLAIGGRDATSNDILVKKHMEVNDLVFHTEIAGSPFFLLKDGREKAAEPDLKEVAQATASYSAAWKLGAASTDVYYVKPEQVTKQAQAGEYLGKGAFMVRGKKNYFRSTALEMAVGVDKDGRVLAGAIDAIRKHCTKYKIIRQGSLKKSDVAKQLAHAFSANVDEVMKSLPTGELQIIQL